jgi:signal transduction histidine kinase
MSGTSGSTDEIRNVKIKVSLYTRFMFWIVMLLLFLVGTIVYVIQRKEVQTISQETRTRGILTAQFIANLNLRSLVMWDEATLRKNVEGQADNKVLYIVFYDRDGKPRAANELVAGREDITCCSHLRVDSRPESFYVQPRAVRIGSKSLDVLEIELPIFVTGSPVRWASIKIGQSLESMGAEVRRTRWVLILIGFGGLALGLAGAAFLAKTTTRPLKALVQGTVRIARGDFSHRIPQTSRDEIGDLARSFNEMTDQLLHARERMDAANRRLVQAEKLASIGRLAATIAHEIRNPLTSVKLNIQRLAESDHLDEIEREHLDIGQEGIGQIEKFIKELLGFTRVSDLNPDRFPLEQIMDESLKMLRDVFRQKKTTIEKTYATGLPAANVDGDRIRQVFLNVLRNASEAVDEGGRISVSIFLARENGSRRYQVRISDNGTGVPEKDWENIFEPFFTTKASGCGLGLANARKIVEQHNGAIRVAKKKGKGTAFVISLPCEEDNP